MARPLPTWFRVVLTLLVAAAVLAAVVLLSRSEAPSFIDRADAVCDRWYAELLVLDRRYGGVSFSDHEQALKAISALYEPARGMTAELARLAPPTDAAAGFRRFVELRQRRDERGDELMALLRKGKSEAAADLQSELVRMAYGPIRRQAEEIGLSTCGQPLTVYERRLRRSERPDAGSPQAPPADLLQESRERSGSQPESSIPADLGGLSSEEASRATRKAAATQARGFGVEFGPGDFATACSDRGLWSCVASNATCVGRFEVSKQGSEPAARGELSCVEGER